MGLEWLGVLAVRHSAQISLWLINCNRASDSQSIYLTCLPGPVRASMVDFFAW